MDAKQVIVLTAILVISAALSSGSTYSIIARNAIIQKHNEGHAELCAKDDPPINLTWSPKNITVGETVTLNVDFVLPVSINSGTIMLSVVEDDLTISYQQPFYKICDKIFKYLDVKCPLKKGDRIHIHNYKLKVQEYFDIQPEKVTLLISNEFNKTALCIKMKPHIIVPMPDYQSLYGDIY